jgi:GntP family gluconate:H+ symporter
MEVSFLHFATLLSVSIVAIILLTVRYQINAFIALLVACLIVGIGASIPILTILDTIKTGFGNTLKSIGLLIIAGTTLGLYLEKTGCATVIAEFLLRKTGKKNTPLALSLTGFIVGLPVFCDSGYIVLSGIAKSLTQQTRISILTLAGTLSTALYAVHCLLPPHPGMSAAAAQLDINLGFLIIIGIFFAIPAAAVGYLWTVYSSKNYHSQPNEVEHESAISDTTAHQRTLPKASIAFLPILIPLFLMMLKPIAQNWWGGHDGFGMSCILTLGEPVIALSVGIILLLLLAKSTTSSDSIFQQAIEKSGTILIIIGAGGAFGAMIALLNPAQYFEGIQLASSWAFVLFFSCAALLKTAQGSSTVAIITTASIMLPLFGAVGIETEIQKVWAILAMGAGSMAISLPNDSYFWVISKFSGLSTGPMIKVYSIATLLMALTTMLCILLAANFF